MDSPCSLPVSPASSSAQLPGRGQEEPAAEKPEETVGTGSRMTAGRRMGRKRLLRYVHDVIRRQRTPLHEILRDHALPFLPAWSLLRLRAVSASWNRHISSPFFAHTQSISHRSPSGLLPTSVPYQPSRYLPFHQDSGAVPDPSFGFLPEIAVRVRASARGLVCCSDLGHPRRRPRYYVSNPATAHWTAVPGSSVYNHHAVALLFQPTPLDFSSDFDLVCVVQSNRRTGFEVFSSSTGKWRLSDEVACRGEVHCSGLAVAAAGAAHWVTAGGDVLSYDPTAGRCRVVRLPESVAPEIRAWQLAEVDGRLCCCCAHGAPSGRAEGTVAVDVFVLDEEGTWTKKRRLEVVGGEVRPLTSIDDEVLFLADTKVVGVNLASGKEMLLWGPAPDVGEFINSGEFLPYVSGLAPVKQFRGELDKRVRRPIPPHSTRHVKVSNGIFSI